MKYIHQTITIICYTETVDTEKLGTLDPECINVLCGLLGPSRVAMLLETGASRRDEAAWELSAACLGKNAF